MSSLSASCERHLETGRRALSLGDVATAEAEFAAAAAEAERSNASPEQLASALSAQAQLLYRARRFAEAEPLFRRALDCRERAEGPDAPSLAPALHNLAAVHLAMDDSGAAEPLLKRALGLLEAEHGEADAELAGVLNMLSQLYLKSGAPADAEPLLRRLLAIRRAEGDDRPEVATVMAGLASVHHALAEHEAAEQLLRRVLEIRQRTLAPNHFAVATTLEALAETCATRGKLDEALGLFERSLGMRMQTLGPSHPSLAIVRAKMADLQLQLSQDVFAVPLMDSIGESFTDAVKPPASRPRASRALAPAPLPSPPPPTTPRTPRAPLSLPAHTAAELAPELGVLGYGAESSQAPEFAAASPLPISVLPTGRALTAPAHSGAAEDVDDDRYFEDDFEGEDGGASHRSSRLGHPVARVLIGAAALVVIAVSTTLALRNVDAGWAPEPSPAGTSVSGEPGSSTLGGSVALSDSGATTAMPLEAANRVSDAESSAEAGRPTAPRDGDTNGDSRASVGSRPSPGSRTPASEAALPALPLPFLEPLPGSVDVGLNQAVPTIRIGGSDSAPMTVRGAPVTRGSGSGVDAYFASPTFRPPAHIGEIPTPAYPRSLAQERLSGEVVVSFMVDTNGRVDANTLRVVRATDMRFVAPVTDLLPELRFMPGELNGQPVRQTVQMPFRFQP